MGATLRRALKGFSLAELLVYQGLLVTLLALTLVFLVPGLRLSARGLNQAELLRGGHLAMDQLCRDLRLCPAAALTYLPESALCGRPGGGWTADGTVYLDDQAWLYDLSAGPQLRRGQFSVQETLKLPPSHGRFSPEQLQLARGACNWRSLCSGLRRFSFEHAGPLAGSPSGPYKVTLSLEVEGQSLVLQQTLQPRMSR